MKIFDYTFFFILAGDLIARAMHPDWAMVEYVFKPLIMISLGEYFIRESKNAKLKHGNYVTIAIVFSLIGDIFLMNDKTFLVGLVAFLIAHIFYILAFRPEASRFFSKKQLLIPATIVLIYGGLLLAVVLPNVDSALKIPIIVYAFTILIMLLTALHRFSNVSAVSFKYVIIGASLFVLSDSMIAISKFVMHFPMDGVWVMATYGIGQYLIVVGYLKNVKKEVVNN